ncbi:DNA damage-binding protein 1 [Escovopsis weberi]|uniref:DNA damage-binding protein 1 n=1 Tax=Escovopsis weberi TaxID=150374 RepID=A0A0M9VXJ3_ESCWE|nr:DNA damage-binding protein 1 [Escovopsis weberi]
MSYIAPIHKPTSVRHALRTRLRSPDAEDLVIAKANRLEIWRVDQEGMTCLHTKAIYGTIDMLQKLQPKDSDTDLLLIGTNRLQYFTIAWNPETNQLDAVKQVIEDVAEPYMRQSQSQNRCLVDPTGKFVLMHLWEGVLNVFRLGSRKTNLTRLDHLGQVRITELWIKTSVFLHNRSGLPQVAFLYKNQLHKEEARLAIYRLTKDDKNEDVSDFDPSKDRELEQLIPDPYTSMLVPVPILEEKRYNVRKREGGPGAKAHVGGLLAVGETLVTYIDGLNFTSVHSTTSEPRIYVAWAAYDGTRFFLADDYGRLDLLELTTVAEQSGDVVTGTKITPLRFPDSSTTTSRASVMEYMGNGMLFVGSHHGDSQLLRLDIESHTMTLVKVMSNNAPIMDFTVMDMGNREGDAQSGNAFSSGQARVVAGCGAYQDGSLRSIRSGVGLEDRGILDEIKATRGLFSLRSKGSDLVDTVVISTVAGTRVLRFEPDTIEEVYSFQGLDLESETHVATNLPSGQLLQITTRSATLLDPESGVAVSSWQPSKGKTITAASANGKWALLSVDGSSLVSLNLLQDLKALAQDAIHSSTTGRSDQISCLHAAHALPDLGVVGWWTSGTISVVDLATLRPLHGESLRQTSDSASVPRDIALVQLHPPENSGPTLLVALEDGNVASFNVSTKDIPISGRKFVTLGSSPARLHILPQLDGTCSVFATTEHASLIYSSEGRIVYSATTADDATFVAPFDSEAFPNSIVLSTEDAIRISQIDKERLTHVKTLPVKETVRRVAYSPSLKAFGLGCVKKELSDNEEIVTSTVRLVDEIVLRELCKPVVLDGSPSGLELVECMIRAELTDGNGNPAERFIVGTSFIVDPDAEATDTGETRGRILVLGVDEDRQLYQVHAHNLRGVCRCLAMMGEYIVAGLSKTVVVYKYAEETSTSATLTKQAMMQPASFPADLDVCGNMIGVGDLMQSLTLLEFVPPAEGTAAKLEERARHFQQGWVTSVCALEDERWMEADAQGNISLLRRNAAAPTENDQRRLEVTSRFNVGEQINRIRRIYAPPNENAVVSPRALLGSVEGTLYLYGDIAPRYQDLLMTFQQRLQDFLQKTAQLSFEKWREFRNLAGETEAAYRFVDGELVEEFLDLDEGAQERVVQGLGPSVEDMRNMIEELRRLH